MIDDPSSHPTRSFGRLLRIAGIAIISSVLMLGTLHAADGPVAAVQRSLKEQQFYFGEITGNVDDETKAALRRYQIHSGLKVTGDLDGATLQALQNASGTADAAPRSGSVREQTQTLVQSDREFLEDVEGVTPPEPVPPIGVSPRSTPPPPPRPVERRVAPPPPAPRERIVQERDEPAEPPTRSGISESDARRFVRRYLRAAEGPTPAAEVSFYADRVNYFTSGRVNRSFIEKDQRNYYRRWPRRQFDLQEEPEVLKLTEDSATVRFRIRYVVQSGEESGEGHTENIVQLRDTADGLKIVSIRERKLRE